MPKNVTATLRKVGGGSEVVELEEGHYTPDAENKVVTFALRMDAWASPRGVEG